MQVSPRLGNLAPGIAIAVFGAWFVWQATTIRQGPGYAIVGPGVFPTIVGLGLLASGVAVIASALPGRRQSASATPEASGLVTEEQSVVDWTALVGLAALLALYLALFLPLGFLLGSTLYLVAAARVLGSHSLLRDLVSGVGLSVAAYLVFTRLLGLELPAGPLEEPIRSLQDRLFTIRRDS